MAAKKTASKTRAKKSDDIVFLDDDEKKANENEPTEEEKEEASTVIRKEPLSMRIEPLQSNSALLPENGAWVGHFATVAKGEHEGKYGTVEYVSDYDKKSGLPQSAVLRTRDAQSERLVLKYEELERAEAGGR